YAITTKTFFLAYSLEPCEHFVGILTAASAIVNTSTSSTRMSMPFGMSCFYHFHFSSPFFLLLKLLQTHSYLYAKQYDFQLPLRKGSYSGTLLFDISTI